MKMKRIMKSTRGEGYIDLAVAVLVLVFVLVIAISLWSAITLKQDMRYMCEELIATATSTGKVGEEVEQRFAELCEDGHYANGHLEYDLLQCDREAGAARRDHHLYADA